MLQLSPQRLHLDLQLAFRVLRDCKVAALVVRRDHRQVCSDDKDVAVGPGLEEIECQIRVCFEERLERVHTLFAHSVRARRVRMAQTKKARRCSSSPRARFNLTWGGSANAHLVQFPAQLVPVGAGLLLLRDPAPQKLLEAVHGLVDGLVGAVDDVVEEELRMHTQYLRDQHRVGILAGHCPV
jgi:hypothetical protein